jgi:hypothetical protein
MKTRSYTISIIFLLLFWGSGPAMGQFVNVNLELPAGVNYPSRVIAPNPTIMEEELVWIEMVAQENLNILVELSYEDTDHAFEEPVYFLNDGTVNFAMAEKLSPGLHFLQMEQGGILIRNMYPHTLRLQAWLGLPARSGIVAKIEYP